MKVLRQPIEFEWDKGNIDKNRKKHNVGKSECEEAFVDDGKVIFKDVLHSDGEQRYILLAKTKKNRLLYLVFTIRKKKIRIISVRDINKKEVSLYEKET
jgi:uncharacterized DUF497 family protein